MVTDNGISLQPDVLLVVYLYCSAERRVQVYLGLGGRRRRREGKGEEGEGCEERGEGGMRGSGD